MKKILVRTAMVASIVLLLGACGNVDSNANNATRKQIQTADSIGKNNSTESYSTVSIPQIIENTEASTDDLEETVSAEISNDMEDAVASSEVDADIESDIDIDIDLTKLSSTMVYSEVYNMMYAPNKYVGKIVKMNGAFVVYTNMEQSQFYPAVIVADATACCSQGIEFILKGNPNIPDGYPEIGIDITVTGTFETYDENGMIFCRLQNATID